LALVRFVAGSGSGAGLVAFVSSPGSRGSFLSVRAAVRAGLPVVVFPVGFAAARLPVLPGGGRWVPVASLRQAQGRLSGVWASGWRWVPAGSSSSDDVDDEAPAEPSEVPPAQKRPCRVCGRVGCTGIGPPACAGHADREAIAQARRIAPRTLV